MSHIIACFLLENFNLGSALKKKALHIAQST